MYIESQGRQMAVCSFDGAVRLTGFDKGYWNVVSIHGPRERKAHLPMARSIHYGYFDDVEEEDSAVDRSPLASDIAGIFGFIGGLGSGPSSAPLLIHCQQGISRSTAVALSWLYGHLPPSEDRVAKAIDLTLKLRPQARPTAWCWSWAWRSSFHLLKRDASRAGSCLSPGWSKIGFRASMTMV